MVELVVEVVGVEVVELVVGTLEAVDEMVLLVVVVEDVVGVVALRSSSQKTRRRIRTRKR